MGPVVRGVVRRRQPQEALGPHDVPERLLRGAALRVARGDGRRDVRGQVAEQRLQTRGRERPARRVHEAIDGKPRVRAVVRVVVRRVRARRVVARVRRRVRVVVRRMRVVVRRVGARRVGARRRRVVVRRVRVLRRLGLGVRRVRVLRLLGVVVRRVLRLLGVVVRGTRMVRRRRDGGLVLVDGPDARGALVARDAQHLRQIRVAVLAGSDRRAGVQGAHDLLQTRQLAVVHEVRLV
mmetsp:Transcript_4510/g.13256  ORF Transcript_4510/g.13256 Transcript_4510/m.13256 type:complete len:237 (+) Transcript_4510:342-1052(+)